MRFVMNFMALIMFFRRTNAINMRKENLHKSNREYVFEMNFLSCFFFSSSLFRSYTQTHCKFVQSINSYNSKLKTHLNFNRINWKNTMSILNSQLKLCFFFSFLSFFCNLHICTTLSKDIQFAIHINMTKAHPFHWNSIENE